jgi:hypothetical protein
MALCGFLADFRGPRSVVNGRPIDMGRGDKVVTVAATERWKVATRSGNLAQRPRPRRPVQGPLRWRSLSGVATRQGDSVTCTAGDPYPPATASASRRYGERNQPARWAQAAEDPEDLPPRNGEPFFEVDVAEHHAPIASGATRRRSSGRPLGDGLSEAMDIDGLRTLLRRCEEGTVRDSGVVTSRFGGRRIISWRSPRLNHRSAPPH